MVQTLISIAPKVAPIVFDVLESDQNHWYGNQFNVDYGIIRTTHFEAFDYEDDFLFVERIDKERSHWWIKSFKPETKIWDGSSLALDKGKIWFLDFNALFKASLAHDVIYQRSDAISEATGIPVDKILAFADDLLKILADGYGASHKMTTPLHKILRFGGSIYHKLKKIVGCIVLVLLCSGCYSIKTQMESPPPEIFPTEPYFEANRQKRFLTTSVIATNQLIVKPVPINSRYARINPTIEIVTNCSESL